MYLLKISYLQIEEIGMIAIPDFSPLTIKRAVDAIEGKDYLRKNCSNFNFDLDKKEGRYFDAVL